VARRHSILRLALGASLFLSTYLLLLVGGVFGGGRRDGIHAITEHTVDVSLMRMPARCWRSLKVRVLRWARMPYARGRGRQTGDSANLWWCAQIDRTGVRTLCRRSTATTAYSSAAMPLQPSTSEDGLTYRVLPPPASPLCLYHYITYYPYATSWGAARGEPAA